MVSSVLRKARSRQFMLSLVIKAILSDFNGLYILPKLQNPWLMEPVNCLLSRNAAASLPGRHVGTTDRFPWLLVGLLIYLFHSLEGSGRASRGRSRIHLTKVRNELAVSLIRGSSTSETAFPTLRWTRGTKMAKRGKPSPPSLFLRK